MWSKESPSQWSDSWALQGWHLNAFTHLSCQHLLLISSLTEKLRQVCPLVSESIHKVGSEYSKSFLQGLQSCSRQWASWFGPSLSQSWVLSFRSATFDAARWVSHWRALWRKPPQRHSSHECLLSRIEAASWTRSDALWKATDWSWTSSAMSWEK